MNKKTILIGLGVLAVAGIGYYMWKKKNETTSGASGCGCGCEEKSNAQAGGNKCDCFNGILTDSMGKVLKDKQGNNRTCKCADNTSAE